MSLRWPGQSGNGVPPGFPGASPDRDARPRPRRAARRRPPRRSDAAAAVEVEVEVEVEADHAVARDEQPEEPLRAPNAPLRSGAAPGPVPRPPRFGWFTELIGTRWPGTGETSIPPNLLRRSDALGPRSHVTVRRTGPVATVTPLRPQKSDSATTPTSGSTPITVTSSPSQVPEDEQLPFMRRVTGPFGTIVTAVYSALADPLVNAPAEVREKRTAQIRRAGTAAAGVALACILVYAVFPVRTYLDQRSATQRRQEQRETLQRANDELERRADELREDDTVEQIAREDYGMVLPGEESYGVLPPPPETTTTTTTAPPG